MDKTTESIYNGKSVIIPLADVQHIERGTYGMQVITDKTKWNFENDTWENAIFVSEKEENAFLETWCRYRSETDNVTPVVQGTWIETNESPDEGNNWDYVCNSCGHKDTHAKNAVVHYCWFCGAHMAQG